MDKLLAEIYDTNEFIKEGSVGTIVSSLEKVIGALPKSWGSRLTKAVTSETGRKVVGGVAKHPFATTGALAGIAGLGTGYLGRKITE
jgi:hypothetical protein